MSWGTVAVAAIGAGGSYLSSREKGKAAKGAASASGKDLRSPELKRLGDTYTRTLQNAVTGFNPGKDFGNTDIGLTSQEQSSLGYLDKYLDQDITQNELYKSGRGEITKTLGGRYDPTTGEFYKSTRAGLDLAEQQAIDTARRGQAARGSFRSSGGLRQEGDILAQSGIAKQQLLGQIAERERERRGAAGQQALGLAEFEAGIPLNKAQAAQTYGSLLRRNELDNLNREYIKWQGQRNELMQSFQMSGQASNEGQPIYNSSSSVVQPTSGFGSALGSVDWGSIIGKLGGETTPRVATTTGGASD